jgi:hypothetical protein
MGWRVAPCPNPTPPPHPLLPLRAHTLHVLVYLFLALSVSSAGRNGSGKSNFFEGTSCDGGRGWWGWQRSVCRLFLPSPLGPPSTLHPAHTHTPPSYTPHHLCMCGTSTPTALCACVCVCALLLVVSFPFLFLPRAAFSHPVPAGRAAPPAALRRPEGRSPRACGGRGAPGRRQE